MNDALKTSLERRLGPRFRLLPDGKARLAPAGDAELRMVVTQFHRFAEALHQGAELDRAALSRIGAVEPQSCVIEADAGATLAAIDRAAQPHGLTVGALSPRALALGLAAFLEGPYAGLRSVLGGRLEPVSLSLEAILPDGIPFVSKASPRSAAGPDLDALILGGEGRFGWVSRATLRLVPRPVSLRRVVHSYPDAATLTRAARRLLSAGCNVQCAWAQRRGGRILWEVELGGTDESIPRDLSTCAHEASEAGGRASEQVLDDAPAGEERELTWVDVEQELARGGRLALFRLSTEAVIATGAARGRPLTGRQAWAQQGAWEALAQALAAPRGDAE